MNFFKQISHLTAANLLFILCQLGILSLLSRLTSVDEVGAFGFVMAVLQPLYMLALMGLRANLATDAKSEHSFGTFLTLRLTMSVVLFLVVIGAIVVARPEFTMIALPIVLQKAVEMMSDLCYGAMQRAGRVDLVARSLAIRGPAALLFFGLVLWSTRSAEVAFWCQTLVWIAVQTLHDFPGARSVGEKLSLDLNRDRLGALVKNTAPLGLGHFFVALQISVPRLLVVSNLGLTALALLTTVSYIERSATGLFQSVDQAIGWRLSRIWSAGTRGEFFRTTNRMLVVAATLGICGSVFAFIAGGQFLGIVFGPEYVAATILLNWVTVAIALRLLGSVQMTALAAQRRFRSFGILQFWVLVATIPAVLAGIQLAGLEGVGIALASIAFLRTAILYVLVRRRA